MTVKQIGRYEILQTLGRGAMGVVYLAQDPVIDRRLAVKTLRVDLGEEHSDEFRERFTREARAAGRLNHRGIVTIHDVGEDPASGLVFIVMEYVQGHDLKQILSSGHRFRPSEAARISADVALALDYAHAEGVIHRDIKPANIILTEDGTAKIMDFGVARLDSSNLTVEGQFIGTPNFMSPEQITGKAVDGRSDIFSLGVLLYYLLTGHRPFAGETMHEVTMKIVQRPCPIPSTVAQGLPAAFNPIVLKCLEKEPDKRFQTGGEVARVLTALVRSVMKFEPTEPAPPVVVSPSLDTHVSQAAATNATEVARPRSISPNTAAMKRPQEVKRKPSIFDGVQKLLPKVQVPPILVQEVTPTWSWGLIIGWFLICAGVIAALVMIRDTGPFHAPSDSSIRNLHMVSANFREAERLLDDGDLRNAHRRCIAGLDQAPTSPGGRLLMATIRGDLDAERSSETTQLKVEKLVSDGRRLYRSGDYAEAASQFEEALEVNPESEVASSFLELTKERLGSRPQVPRQPSTRVTSAVPTPNRRRSTSSQTRARPTPGTSRITLFFNSPINAGSVTVSRDGETIADIPFDFTRRVMGIKRKGTGKIKRVLMIPSGKHTVDVVLNEVEAGSIGSSSFTEVFPGGSDWTLRVDLPNKEATPTFYLVKSGS